MPRPVKWTPEKLEELRQLVLSGMSNIEIAHEMGERPHTISNICYRFKDIIPPRTKRAGRDRSSYKPLRWTGTERSRLGLLKYAGWTRKQLATYYSVTPGAIQQVLDKYGFKLRKYEQWTLRELMEMKELADKGLTGGQIAIRQGWDAQKTYSAVRYYRERAKEGKGPWAT